MKTIAKWIKRITVFFLLSSIGMVFVYKYIPVYITPLMVIRMFEKNEAKSSFLGKHKWVPLSDISVNLQKAVIASEDGKFTTHNGFDIDAIEEAMEDNQKGKKLRGGSTISQQTAKNVFLWPGRSYVRKAFEVYFTFWIELVWGKERIMEVYLNSIEMGPGIYGAEAAANKWFNKSAKTLTKREAAAIAVILPNPRVYKAKGGSLYIERRIRFISRQMDLYPKPNYQKKSKK